MTGNDKQRTVTGVDLEENEVVVVVKRPTAQDYNKSQIAYNKSFREALDSGALLRQKLTDYMSQQGLWDKKKEKQYEELVKEINDREESLKGGGIRLSQAKEIALQLKEKREDFRELLSEKNSLDNNSAEGQADNARFVSLVSTCIYDASGNNPKFADIKAYEAQADQPWAAEAASELANMLYNLDPNYDKNLEENKFLKEFNFVDEELRLINDEGHLTDSDGRLINDDGRFIAYRTKKGKKDKNPDEVYFVNREGEEVVKITNSEGEEEWIKISLKERKPFLDEEDKPIEAKLEEEEEKKPKAKTTRRKTTAKKTDAKTP
tara:strand:+ start:2840 stop:3802 length:963 start_codon:yes stop_codon:yes gene_type:complete